MTQEKNENIDRRKALSILGGAIAGLWSLAAAALVGIFATSPLRRATGSKEISLGKQPLFNGDFQLVRLTVPIEDGWHKREDHKRVYARITKSGQPEVISAICSHLGCAVKWNAGESEFHCPCHGGIFDAAGNVIAGPPPAPLSKVPAQLRDGELYIEIT